MFKFQTRRTTTREIVYLYYAWQVRIKYVNIIKSTSCTGAYLQSVAVLVPAVRPRVQRAVTIFDVGLVDVYEPPPTFCRLRLVQWW
jgi:hypothetical protein